MKSENGKTNELGFQELAAIHPLFFLGKRRRAAHQYIKKVKKGKRSHTTQNTLNTQ
jgi:hypothetical protein